jgi:hypothetical protein
MEIRASIEKVPEGTLKTHHQNLNSPALGEGIRKEITLQKMGTGIDRNTDGAE